MMAETDQRHGPPILVGMNVNKPYMAIMMKQLIEAFVACVPTDQSLLMAGRFRHATVAHEADIVALWYWLLCFDTFLGGGIVREKMEGSEG